MHLCNMKSLNLFIILSFACVSMVSADTYDDIISKALNNPARAANNVPRDESRKPGEIIKFIKKIIAKIKNGISRKLYYNVFIYITFIVESEIWWFH